ncbi:MAG: tyrosine-protein phosphatase, partial [Bdellovibrionales bacterium]|nr:tyrosine-protein phosphatase [Bdellovibrionales bacterium]
SAIPSRETVLTILELMKDLEEPVLIHCKSGTHRTGFLSALWLFNQQPEQTELAFQQLSLKFGFVGLERWLKATFEQRPTLDAVIWEYQRFHQACGIRFREWVDSSYMARYYPIAMRDAPRITSRASTQAR